MLRVGLTGGIGAGKSTVASRLRELGAVVVDGDVIAREIVEPGQPALVAIRERFGDTVVRDDGSLDRAALAAIVFPDPAALSDLEAITGPAIAASAATHRAAVADDVVTVYDMPLLVEKRLWVSEHLTVVVGAEEQVRVRRLVEQRGLGEDDVRHRMARQATDAQRRAAADVWLDNSGSRAATLAQVDALWQDRLRPYDANLRSATAAPVRAGAVAADTTWPAQAERLCAKIADAVDSAGFSNFSVEHVGPASVADQQVPDVVSLVLSVQADADAALLSALAARGFVASVGGGTGHADVATREVRLESCDPGRPATLLVRPSTTREAAG